MIRLIAAALAALLLAGCSATKEAVATGGDFQFVAPGGQTTIRYDPPESRGTVRGISGDSLLHDGATVGLDDYAGKVVIVNIWGSWCGPCREEMPGLQFVQEQTGAAVLGIDVRDERQAAADFVRDRGVTFDSVFDPPGRILARLSGYPRNTVPSTLVLDEQHRVAAVFLTVVRVPELMPLVQRLQAEPSPSP
ncbi:TlpA family protein disulfide reductase [Pseudonocardia sp. DSM 110487]|uniref:TlpA family protein disulfide reductase n=1 Tax=Pseudonocardia sp. DSM 110487 TaxID=2865833 RepID=UPI001C6A0E24|nr:TlpA disulfide reductase family protein [Pseudonocardia sp. DSM 110487]QYN35276.1 TlpA family protein disulfide reductase [Pseudonocardia sp. DSM 110487]